MERGESLNELQILNVDGIECYEKDGTAYFLRFFEKITLSFVFCMLLISHGLLSDIYYISANKKNSTKNSKILKIVVDNSI